MFFGSLNAEKLEGKYFGLLTSKIGTVEVARSSLVVPTITLFNVYVGSRAFVTRY